MKIKDSGLPQAVIAQTPKMMRWTKLPIVKAKIGPQVMSLICDEKIFDLVPVKKEVKKVTNKISSPKKPKVETQKVIKSKSVSVFDKLQLIYSEVDRILGRYKENTQVIRTKQDLVDYIDASISNGVLAIDTETWYSCVRSKYACHVYCDHGHR